MLQSRKFKAVLFDFVFALVLFFGAKYLNASAAEDVQFLIASMQPVVGLYIWGVAYEDGQEKRAGDGPTE